MLKLIVLVLNTQKGEIKICFFHLVYAILETNVCEFKNLKVPKNSEFGISVKKILTQIFKLSEILIKFFYYSGT